MLEPILGNSTAGKILFLLLTFEERYARQMPDTFGMPVNGIQQQDRRLEEGRVPVSRLKRKTGGIPV